MLQHDHVLALRGPRTLTHATAPTPHGRPREERGAGAEEAGVVLGVEYLRRHANASWMLERRPLLERLQVERLCRGEDLRVSAGEGHSCYLLHYFQGYFLSVLLFLSLLLVLLLLI